MLRETLRDALRNRQSSCRERFIFASLAMVLGQNPAVCCGGVGQLWGIVMEKKNIIIPWISICCLLFGMYTGFATEFSYSKFNWWFLVVWTAVLSAAAVLLVLQWKPWISALLTIPALILAGLYGYSHMEELKRAADAAQMLLSRQMAKYNGTAVLSDAPGMVDTWGVRESLEEGQMEMLFLLCVFCCLYMYRDYAAVFPYLWFDITLYRSVGGNVRGRFTGSAFCVFSLCGHCPCPVLGGTR